MPRRFCSVNLNIQPAADPNLQRHGGSQVKIGAFAVPALFLLDGQPALPRGKRRAGIPGPYAAA